MAQVTQEKQLFLFSSLLSPYFSFLTPCEACGCFVFLSLSVVLSLLFFCVCSSFFLFFYLPLFSVLF